MREATVKEKVMLSERHVRLSLDVEGEADLVLPGDHVAVYPVNDAGEVWDVIDRLTDLPKEEEVVQINGEC